MNIAYAWMVAMMMGLLATAIPLGSIDTPYSAYNGDIVGLGAKLPEDAFWAGSVRLHHGELDGLDPEADGLLIVAPRLLYTDVEADRLRAFLAQGGRAIIADDDGTARELLRQLQLGIEIETANLFSTSYEKSPRFPILAATGELPGPARVLAEQPKIVAGAGTSVLESHPYTWRDANNNQLPDLGEAQGEFAIARLLAFGAGELLVVGDPDLLTGVLDAQNPGLTDSWLAWLTEGRVLVVDEGHHATSNPMGLARTLAGDHAPTVVLLAGVAVLAMIGWAMRWRIRRVRPKRKKRPAQGPSPALQELEP